MLSNVQNLFMIIYYRKWTIQSAEAVVQRCSVKKVSLEISQNLKENTCPRVSFLIKLLASYFPLNFAKFLRTPLYKEQL